MITPADGLKKIMDEYYRAKEIHPPFECAMDGWIVIKDQLDDLWNKVSRDKQSKKEMEKKVANIGAMALRFMIDVCGKQVITERHDNDYRKT